MGELVTISQADRFAKNHGYTFRSSGMFYFRQGEGFRSSFSLMNHFKLKNNADVALLASVRAMDGALIRRDRLAFDAGDVIVYSPEDAGVSEGSVEIEAFSARDLRIPFTAIAALYEAPRSSALVHAYGRVYSAHEIEDGRTVPVGREAGWSVRDRAGVRSFCVFHNGAVAAPAQRATVEVVNRSGERVAVKIDLPDMKPYQTTRIVLADHAPTVAAFLGGEAGTANVAFRVNGAFTRMLVGNETDDGAEFHATHSNFNYAQHRTDAAPGDAGVGYMAIPNVFGREKQVVVYPEFSPGRYHASWDGGECGFDAGVLLDAGVAPTTMTFTRTDGALPARIVTGLVVDNGAGLDTECSLGVFHAGRPDKRLSWGPCAAADRLDAHLIVTDLAELKGGMPADGTAELRVYATRTKDYLSATLGPADLGALAEGVAFDALIPGVGAHLGGALGYYTLYSDYGGLACYTAIRSPHGLVSVEHSF